MKWKGIGGSEITQAGEVQGKGSCLEVAEVVDTDHCIPTSGQQKPSIWRERRPKKTLILKNRKFCVHHPLQKCHGLHDGEVNEKNGWGAFEGRLWAGGPGEILRNEPILEG